MKSAVEWLMNELEYDDMPSWMQELFDKAKEMEKQQIIEAFLEGCSDNNNDGYEYYNETFNK